MRFGDEIETFRVSAVRGEAAIIISMATNLLLSQVLKVCSLEIYYIKRTHLIPPFFLFFLLLFSRLVKLRGIVTGLI